MPRGGRRKATEHVVVEQKPKFLQAVPTVSVGLFGARRLPELRALWADVIKPDSENRVVEESLKSSGRTTSVRHLRRRTTCFVSRKRHRYPTGRSDTNNGEISKKESTSRKARRKRPKLRQEHAFTQANAVVKWMPTHLWHAKRFHMTKLYGWKVPLQHVNRGCVAAERLLQKEGRTLIQDVSWRMQPIVLELRGTDLSSFSANMKRYCPDFNCVNDDDEIASKVMGTGILFEMDRYPMGVVGPVKWWVRPVSSSSRGADGITHKVLLYCHPSIKSHVTEMLSTTTQRNVWTVATAPAAVACFQLRGKSATSTVKDALKVYPNGSTSARRHFSISKTDVGIEKQTSVHHGGESSSRPLGLEKNQIFLICHDPPSSSDSSLFLDGWDVLCALDEAHAIFMALVNHSKSVVIGMVEEVHLELSCTSTVFPLAFPDSQQGRQYWESSSNDDDNGEWSVLRAAIESRGGRLNLKQQTRNLYRELEQTASLQLEEAQEEIHPVVVRGEFGRPFVDLIEQCVRLPSKYRTMETETTPQRRRRRRPAIHPDTIRLAPPLSLKASNARRTVVTEIVSSLSIATLCRCVLTVKGKGTLVAGDTIHGCAVSADGRSIKADRLERLGVVTGGSFVAGSFSGSGFVGASRLLQFLASTQNPSMTVLDNNQAVHLVVEVNRGGENSQGSKCKATLSLIL